MWTKSLLKIRFDVRWNIVSDWPSKRNRLRNILRKCHTNKVEDGILLIKLKGCVCVCTEGSL